MQNYYNHSSFLNTIVATDIAIENHIANLYFGGDLTRIVYSSNAYSFRKRTQQLKKQSLDLPFYNYKLIDVSVDTDRRWFNHPANVDGYFIPELKRKLKIQPITLSYEATAYFHTELDTHFAAYKSSWDAGNETLIRPTLEISTETETFDVALNAVFNVSTIKYNPSYDESDWLEKNRIRTIGADFEIQTFFIKENFNFGIPNKVIFEFSNSKNWEYGNDPDKTYQAIIDHLTENVGDFSEV